MTILSNVIAYELDKAMSSSSSSGAKKKDYLYELYIMDSKLDYVKRYNHCRQFKYATGVDDIVEIVGP